MVASQFLTPGSSTFSDTVSKEIHHKLAAQYTNQVREELMTSVKPAAPVDNKDKDSVKEFDDPSSVLRQRKSQLLLGSVSSVSPPKNFESVMKDEQRTQEDITNDLILLAQSLKEQSNAANMFIRKDVDTLSKSNALAEDNRGNLLTQTMKLQERSGFCGRCWVWLLVIFICFMFIGMFNSTISIFLVLIFTDFYLFIYRNGCFYASLQEEKRFMTNHSIDAKYINTSFV